MGNQISHDMQRRNRGEIYGATSAISAVDSRGAGGARAPPEFGGSERGEA